MDYLLLISVIYLLIKSTKSQDMFFYGVIDCYKCVGKSSNSSCSDPFTRNEKLLQEFEVIPCDRGACLKRYYISKEGVPMISRTCTNEIDFKLPLVNNVCQQENDGVGYLCMCGRTLCNSAMHISSSTIYTMLGVVFSLYNWI